MAPKHFPLRWESTGDQWWFASPIDWAAANGHYDLVRELLHLDTNLLIKLTSLPRIRRLETVWDDDENFSDVASCRSQVARKLFQECEASRGQHNSLIRAGYGGWLLYTAASAGDLDFVRELLGRDPLLVFGEGEYGVTDILYAAARSRNCDVFKMVFDFCVSPKGEVSSVFRSEVVSRAVHAAARGGNVAALKDLLMDGGGVLGYRDVRGSTVLHAAAARGQVEVVEHLISSYDDIINAVDHRGNTALHVAAYRGHVSVLKLLISASPSSASLTNNYGDTLLHMAVSGFRSPGFRRVDRQIHLMKRLVNGDLLNIEEIINVQNDDGRMALHVAVMENVQTEIVQLIMRVRSVNLNARDAEGNTPLDLLRQRPRSESSEVLIKQLISAGGISDRTARNALVSRLRMHGIGSGSPGTSFKIPDGEILLYTSTDELSEMTGSDYNFSGEITRVGSTEGSTSSKYKKSGSLNNRLKMLFNLHHKKDSNADKDSDDYSIDSYKTTSNSKHTPIPLRQQYARASSLPNNKRVLSLPGNLFPSPSTRKKFAAGLSQGVLQLGPKQYIGSPSSAVSESSLNGVDRDSSAADQSPKEDNPKMKRKHGSFNLRLMNNYICFGAQGLAVENSTRQGKNHQHSVAV